MAATAVRTSRLYQSPSNIISRGSMGLGELLELHNGKKATAISISNLYLHGKWARREPQVAKMKSAVWLHRELGIRLAHRVFELKNLPLGLGNMPSVIDVKEMYEKSFMEIVTSPVPDNQVDEAEFSNMLEAIRRRHDTVVVKVARGVLELKDTNKEISMSDRMLKHFLDSFYMSRIGIRVLISHHLNIGDDTGNMFGIVNNKCCPATLVEGAIQATRRLACEHYGEAPEVEVRGKTEFTFPYVDNHLFLCMFEVLKNSLRATCEKHRDSVLPPVRVIVAEGESDIAIKVADEGGGFPRSVEERLWDYLYTTAELTAKELLAHEQNSQHSGRPDPIAGFGYGLPLSRLYARYWGGDLKVTPMDGYGCDAMLILNKLGENGECKSGLEASSGRRTQIASNL